MPLAVLQKLHEQVLEIAAYFGRPMDIGWCAVQEQAYLLQARPLRQYQLKSASGRWTTAIFGMETRLPALSQPDLEPLPPFLGKEPL